MATSNLPVPLPDLPDELLRDSTWRAVLHVLAAPRYAVEPRIWRHVTISDDEAWIDWPAILAEHWSESVANLLVAVAHLWGDATVTHRLLPPVDVGDLVCRLDDDNWRLLLGALAIRRAGRAGTAWPLDAAWLCGEVPR